MKIAISGKGGVGKSTIAAGLIKHLAACNYQVYAVDADPDTSLGLLLELPAEKLGALKPIVAMRQLIYEHSGGDGAFFSLNPEVDNLLAAYTVRSGNIHFLKMGAVKHGGTACYCRENAVLNAMINILLLKQQELVVLDMGAGIEHLTRGTARGVDLMLIVTEPSLASIQTARVIQQLARELGIAKIKYIANKIRQPRDKEFILKHLPPGEVMALIPFQTEILEQAAGFNGEQDVIPTEIMELAVSVLRV